MQYYFVGVQETGLWRTSELIRGFNDLKVLYFFASISDKSNSFKSKILELGEGKYPQQL